MRRCRSAPLVIAPRLYQPLPPPLARWQADLPLRHLPHACEHLVPGLGPDWSSVHVGAPCPLGSPHSASNPSRSSMLSSPAAGRLRTCLGLHQEEQTSGRKEKDADQCCRCPQSCLWRQEASYHVRDDETRFWPSEIASRFLRKLAFFGGPRGDPLKNRILPHHASTGICNQRTSTAAPTAQIDTCRSIGSNLRQPL
jgi:hypothetical protein